MSSDLINGLISICLQVPTTTEHQFFYHAMILKVNGVFSILQMLKYFLKDGRPGFPFSITFIYISCLFEFNILYRF